MFTQRPECSKATFWIPEDRPPNDQDFVDPPTPTRPPIISQAHIIGNLRSRRVAEGAITNARGDKIPLPRKKIGRTHVNLILDTGLGDISFERTGFLNSLNTQQVVRLRDFRNSAPQEFITARKAAISAYRRSQT